MAHVIDYDFGISAIDSGYQRPLLDAIHLIVEGDRAAIIDTGANSSVPRVLEALRAKGLRPEQVDYVILTHIHLDHAGGAGLLLSKLPNAILTVHPRGARHIVDPRKLIEGTIAVYGEAATHRTYGDIMPVPRARIVETAHHATLKLNRRELVFFDTPGHARHHVCVLDTQSGHLFAGDTFGLSYRELDCDGRQFVFPTSSPVQFDPAAEHRSLDLILGLKPGAIYVTHYSQVRDIARMGDDMHRLVEAHEQLARRERNAGEARHERLKAGIQQLVLGEARRYRWRLPREHVLEVFAGDIELNAQGLGVWLDAERLPAMRI
jgi:glyoxylase-like metal-dependent hydrolase (beta-lactamase superfamily II)